MTSSLALKLKSLQHRRSLCFLMTRCCCCFQPTGGHHSDGPTQAKPWLLRIFLVVSWETMLRSSDVFMDFFNTSQSPGTQCYSKTCLGISRPHLWPKKLNSDCTFSRNWAEQEPRAPLCTPTEATLKASWPAASSCGTAPAASPAARACSAQWEQRRRSLASLFPPY